MPRYYGDVLRVPDFESHLSHFSPVFFMVSSPFRCATVALMEGCDLAVVRRTVVAECT